MNIADLRKEYTAAGLREAEMHADPIEQFSQWLRLAVAAELPEPNAMTLATVDGTGGPSARMVLLKGVDARGFVFFTSYTSRKGRELAERPRAALVFFWGELERQVRVEGAVEKVSREETERYFASRPRGSRLGAWSSNQSAVVGSREELEKRLERLEEEYLDRDIPAPPSWGGFRVIPSAIEFWQGRANRLHDRIVYQRGEGGWVMRRLGP
jgi:pyridoxamine 5'-phosphate oxidase